MNIDKINLPKIQIVCHAMEKSRICSPPSN